MWAIEPSVPRSHAFSFGVQENISGFRDTGFLTYDLRSPEADRRTLLLVTKQRRRDLSNVLNAHAHNFLELEKEIKQAEALGQRAIEIAKSLVNEIHRGQLNYIPEASVAVHRFGPVPVFIVPEFEQSIVLYGRERTCRIAFYPAMRDHRAPQI